MTHSEVLSHYMSKKLEFLPKMQLQTALEFYEVWIVSSKPPYSQANSSRKHTTWVKLCENLTEFRIESLYSYYLQSLCRLLLWKSDKYRLSKRNSGVITSKVCKDFPRESANTFAPSKVCIDFHSESPGRLSGRKYLQTLVESLCRLWR